MESTKGERTRRRILSAAKKLFGAKNYDFVTTRMIAKEANCSQSAISFYFETKEKLCEEVIDDIIRYHELYYGPIAESIEESRKQNRLTPEAALGYLQQYLQMQIQLSLDPRNRGAIGISVNGSSLPTWLTEKLNGSIKEKVSMPMAELIVIYAGLSWPKALVFSQVLTNCIIAFPFTGPFVRDDLILYADGDPKDEEMIRMIDRKTQQYILEFCLEMLRGLKQEDGTL